MAIKKSLVMDNGAEGEYWKVVDIHFEKIGLIKTIRVVLALFDDKEHADSDKRLGCDRGYMFELNSEEAAGDLIKLSYEKIKQTVEFYASGEDV